MSLSLFLTTDSSVSASPQRCKQPRYELTKEQKQMIKADSVNKKVWDDVLTTVKAQGSVRFIILLLVQVARHYETLQIEWYNIPIEVR